MQRDNGDCASVVQAKLQHLQESKNVPRRGGAIPITLVGYILVEAPAYVIAKTCRGRQQLAFGRSAMLHKVPRVLALQAVRCDRKRYCGLTRSRRYATTFLPHARIYITFGMVLKGCRVLGAPGKMLTPLCVLMPWLWQNRGAPRVPLQGRCDTLQPSFDSGDRLFLDSSFCCKKAYVWPTAFLI